MTRENAIEILTAHRNGIIEYSYSDRKEALSALSKLVIEWCQRVDGIWQLIIVGYHE
jgi:hypothetical protein